MTYYICDHVVTIEYRKQFIAFTQYTLKNKKRFNEFVIALQDSRGRQYGSLNDLFGLARRYRLVAVRGYKPQLKEKAVADLWQN